MRSGSLVALSLFASACGGSFQHERRADGLDLGTLQRLSPEAQARESADIEVIMKSVLEKCHSVPQQVDIDQSPKGIEARYAVQDGRCILDTTLPEASSQKMQAEVTWLGSGGEVETFNMTDEDFIKDGSGKVLHPRFRSLGAEKGKNSAVNDLGDQTIIREKQISWVDREQACFSQSSTGKESLIDCNQGWSRLLEIASEGSKYLVQRVFSRIRQAFKKSLPSQE